MQFRSPFQVRQEEKSPQEKVEELSEEFGGFNPYGDIRTVVPEEPRPEPSQEAGFDLELLSEVGKKTIATTGLAYMLKDAKDVPVIGIVSSAAFSPVGTLFITSVPIICFFYFRSPQKKFEAIKNAFTVTLVLGLVGFIYPVIENAGNHQGLPQSQQSEYRQSAAQSN